MEKDKSRYGAANIFRISTNTKGTQSKNPKHVPLPTKPVLESNEDRYVEDKSNSHSFQLSSSTDFAILSKTPISRGHHFQFKSDKLLADEAETKASGDLFSIDVEAIHNSILTVPFYERIQMDEAYFSESEKKYMRSEAAEHLRRTLEKLKRCEEKKPKHKEPNKIDHDVSDIQKDIEKCVLDSPTSCTEKRKSRSDGNKRTVPDNDLEQWLDDILDD